MTEIIHWVDKYLVPLNFIGTDECRKYPTAQEWWEDCTDPDHLLLMLQKIEACDDQMFRLMACDFAEHVLPAFEESHPTDKKPHDTIAAARKYANDPSEENRKEMKVAKDALDDAKYSAVYYALDYTGYNAAYYAGCNAGYSAGYNTENSVAERHWQCDKIREYCPKSPFNEQINLENARRKTELKVAVEWESGGEESAIKAETQEKFRGGAVRDKVNYRFDLCSPVVMAMLLEDTGLPDASLKEACDSVHAGEYIRAAVHISRYYIVWCMDMKQQVSTSEIYRQILFAYARAMHEGVAKYGERNWETGMDAGNLINHAIAHIVQLAVGDTTEAHFDHVIWNLMTLTHFEEAKETD